MSLKNQLEISLVTINKKTLKIAFSGEFDAYTPPEIKYTIYRQSADGPKFLIIDLSELRYMDSNGFGFLLGLLKQRRETGHHLIIIRAKEHIDRVFRITRLDKMFTICDSEEQALQAITNIDS